MTTYETVSLLILVVSAAVLIYQVRLASDSIRLDHDRRRKVSTIDHLHQIRPQYRKVHDLVKRLGPGPLNDEAVQHIMEDDELHEDVKEIMGMFEHLAAGTNAGVFDVVLLNRLSGHFLMSVHARFRPYFECRRRKTGNPLLYEEYDALVAHLQAIRAKADQRTPPASSPA